MNFSETVLIIILAVFAIVLTMAGFELDREQANVEQYKSEIERLDLKSKEQAEIYKEYQEQADDEMKAVEMKQEAILADDVPKKCQDSIKWGITQGKAFS